MLPLFDGIIEMFLSCLSVCCLCFIKKTSVVFAFLLGRTTTTFKLKKRVAVSDLWLAPNLGNSDEVGSGSLPLSFIIGWPLATNYLFLFTKAEQKMMWMTALER